MATEWLKNPVTIFAVHKSKFRMMPAMLDREAYALFTAISDVFGFPLKYSLISCAIIGCSSFNFER